MTGNRDRRLNSANDLINRIDPNLGEQITDFHGIISGKTYYRITSDFFTTLGLVNFPHKIDTMMLF